LEAERPGPGAVARGRALAARPTRPEQKAAAAAGCRWRRRLGAELPGRCSSRSGPGGAPYSAGAEGDSGGWEPGPKNRVVGKEEKVSGSFCGGI
jgi:hypothetical protein